MPFVRLVSVALVATACSSGIKTLQVTPAPRQAFAVMASDTAAASHGCIASSAAGGTGCAATAHVAHAGNP